MTLSRYRYKTTKFGVLHQLSWCENKINRFRRRHKKAVWEAVNQSSTAIMSISPAREAFPETVGPKNRSVEVLDFPAWIETTKTSKITRKISAWQTLESGYVQPENTYLLCKGKYHCTPVALLFECFVFNQTSNYLCGKFIISKAPETKQIKHPTFQRLLTL